MSTRDDALDLSARARRGQASEEELKRLRAGLSASATLRVAHQVGADFDAALRVKASDSQLIDEVIARALAQATTPLRPERARRRFAVWLAAAAALLCSTGALAWWGSKPARRPPVQTPGAVASVASSPARSAEPQATRGATTSAAPASKATPQRSAPDKLGLRLQDYAPSAGALFVRANQARSAMRETEAIELYRRLQSEHPDSAEALTSRIALGRLLLARGDPDSAVSEFDRHLSAGGALAEEALLWKARALRRVGNADQERQVLRALLLRFPNTAYEREAKTRLGLAKPATN